MPRALSYATPSPKWPRRAPSSGKPHNRSTCCWIDPLSSGTSVLCQRSPRCRRFPRGLLELALRVPLDLPPSQMSPDQHDAHDHQKDDDVCEQGSHHCPKQTPDTMKRAGRHGPEDCQSDRDEVGDRLPPVCAVIAT